jgi:hypothetical protein
MASNREYVQLVDHLMEVTQNGVVSWSRYDPPINIVSTENDIDFIYTTEYKGKNIRLYEETYKYYTDEFEYHWQKRIVIEFVDEFSNSVWQFPEIRNSWNLLEAIRYKDAGVAGFMKDIFGP